MRGVFLERARAFRSFKRTVAPVMTGQKTS